jgi:hypothetical protein
MPLEITSPTNGSSVGPSFPVVGKCQTANVTSVSVSVVGPKGPGQPLGTWTLGQFAPPNWSGTMGGVKPATPAGQFYLLQASDGTNSVQINISVTA